MLRQSEARTGARRGRSTTRAVRLVLAAGTLLILGVLALEMSPSAPRTAGSNRVQPQAFSLFPAGGQTVCQGIEGLPYDAGRVSVLIGTYGRVRPPVQMKFLGADGGLVAQAAAGRGPQGYVVMPLRRVSRAPAGSVCLRIAAGPKVALGGEVVSALPGGARLDGKPQPGDMTIFYYRPHNETWWQLLPVLDQRFGWGKAPFFGSWTLLFVVALVVLVWAAALRLAVVEFR
ncbi:MAG TPA: hypothetical protein VMD09_18095 [Solirubrobacteraceae bacterium]|nr:hypothetical protein [Solirubrobacteraceae bacterium]